MKTLLFFAIPLLLLNFGCSNNSGPSNNSNNNGGNNQTSFDGGPYLALSDNETFNGHLVGTIKYLDTSGTVTETDQIDQNSSETIGALENHGGLVGRALYYFPHGEQTLIGYVGSTSDTSEVVGFRQTSPWSNSYSSTYVMPKNMTVGEEWSPSTPSTISCQVFLVDHLNQFTAANNKSYSDVLKFNVSYLDSSGYYWSDVYKGKGTLYFSKGVGLVEADVQNYEHIQYGWNWQANDFGITYHQVASGTATRN